MLEFRYDPIPAVQPYLDRIGYRGGTELTRETLNELVWAHQLAVPFENLNSCYFHTPVELSVDKLYNKIVLQRRGGYCFEMNGLFMALLRGLGFDAYSCMCRIASAGDTLRPILHRGTIVRLNGKRYFCDVGMGTAMAPFAVEFTEERQTFRGETYWIEPTHQDWFLLRRIGSRGMGDPAPSDDTIRNSVVIGPQPALSEDFEGFNVLCSEKPDSPFVKGYNLTQRLEDGFISLRGTTFTEKHGTEYETHEATPAELPEIMKRLRLDHVWGK